MLLDEGVPKSVQGTLQKAGYGAKRVQDLGERGISNGAVLELALSLRRILLTRDSDFLKLTTGFERNLKVIYLESFRNDPDLLASHVESFIERSLRLTKQCDVVILTEKGPKCLKEFAK